MKTIDHKTEKALADAELALDAVDQERESLDGIVFGCGNSNDHTEDEDFDCFECQWHRVALQELNEREAILENTIAKLTADLHAAEAEAA